MLVQVTRLPYAGLLLARLHCCGPCRLTRAWCACYACRVGLPPFVEFTSIDSRLEDEKPSKLVARDAAAIRVRVRRAHAVEADADIPAVRYRPCTRAADLDLVESDGQMIQEHAHVTVRNVTEEVGRHRCDEFMWRRRA
jgi:hypothetical protein